VILILTGAFRETGKKLEEWNGGIFQYSSIPIFQYSNIPVFQYSSIPIFRALNKFKKLQLLINPRL